MLRHPLALVAGLVLAAGAAGLLYDTLSDEPSGEAAGPGEKIYWANGVGGIAFADLSGGNGADLDTTGATVVNPAGTALDLVNERVWWANANGTSGPLSYADMDGGNGGDLAVTGVTVDNPVGLTIDSAAGKVYWVNNGANQISYANLDGSGAGNVNTGSASVSNAHGVAVNLARTKIYWANYGNGTISYANLDGSGGEDLDTTGATVSSPNGVALDPATGRIWWANRGAGISYANADDSGGGGDLDTTGATVTAPYGVAIDRQRGRIWWANLGVGEISYADLDGGNGGDLDTTGATKSTANFPSLLLEPRGIGVSIAGSRVVGAPLSCGATWLDSLPTQAYRLPGSVTYAWSRDGSPVAGATSRSLIPSSTGAYTCAATGANAAGDATQVSGLLTVTAALTLGKAKPNKKNGTAKLSVSAGAAGLLRLSGKNVAIQKLTVASAGTVSVPVKPKGALKRKLASKGKASVKVTVAFTPSGGTPTTLGKKVKLSKRLS